MADYFLDDAANGTNDGAAWETCYNTWAQVSSAGILATGGNRLFVGADANITDPGAALSLTGPTSGAPVLIISSTVGSGTTVSYAAGTGTQIDTDSGAYGITIDGSFAFFGIKFTPGERINVATDSNEYILFDSCDITVADNKDLFFGGASSWGRLKKCTIKTADTASRATPLVSGTTAVFIEIEDCTFGTGCSNRTGTGLAGAYLFVSGCDLSGFPTFSGSAGLFGGTSYVIAANCKLAASPGNLRNTTAGNAMIRHMLVNCSAADAPEKLAASTYGSDSVVSNTSVYRDATVEDAGGVSWLMTSVAGNTEFIPLYTPWIYGSIASAGTKTFTVHVANGTADYTDAELWLELEVMSTSDVGKTTLYRDWRGGSGTADGSITATPQTQTDPGDDSANWTGSPGANYQTLVIANVTVGETGQFRARVAFAPGAARTLYVNPKVHVT